MDKTIQRIIIFLGLFGSVAFGQCPKKVINVTVDTLGCKQIHMSDDMWGHYYLADKNLKIIEDSIPKLAHNIERKAQKNEEILAKTQEQVKLAQDMLLIHKEGREDCDNALVTIAVKNMRLQKKLKKKNTFIKAAGVSGFIIGILFSAIIP